MKDSKTPAEVGTMPDQAEKSTSGIEAEQKEKEKYDSEPEGKVKFGDFLVRISSQSSAQGKTNCYLAISVYFHMLQNGTLYYYLSDLLPQ
jgi:hypothetical protein